MLRLVSPTTTTVDFPGSDASGLGGLISATVVQSVGAHDLFVLDLAGSPDNYGRVLATGAPLRLRVSNELGERLLVGYVDSVRVTVAEGQTTRSRVVGIGTSYVFKERGALTGQATVSETVERLVRGHGLFPVVGDFPLAQTVLQSGRSEWEVLCDLAGRVGAWLHSGGSALSMLTPEESFRLFSASAPQLGARAMGGDYRGQFSTFEYTVTDNGSHTDAWRAERVVSGVDPITAAVVARSEGSGMFTDYAPGVVARSIPGAQAKAGGSAGLGALNRVATTVGVGDQTVAPGVPVWVSHPRSGWWFVKSVKHVLDPVNKKYAMNTELVTNRDFLRRPAPEGAPAVPLGAPRIPRPRLRRPSPSPMAGEGWARGMRWVADLH